MIAVGSVVGGRYTIRSRIGAGGMQDVYRATDKILAVDVALKTPLPGQPKARFVNSAILAARINHHNIAKTLDCFEENGSDYLIEEFVDGQALDELMKLCGFIDPHVGARLLHNLAKGLSASHHAGVVHRDLKPSNVVAAGGLNLSSVKITDFGIATLTDEVFEDARRAGDITMSRSGTIRGALPFMAPEMMFGKAGDRTGSAVDVWSLGAMMFTLLTGKFPFGEFLTAAVNVKNEKREPWPDFMTSNDQFAKLAKELQNIVEACLSYDPNKRPDADSLCEGCEQLCYLSARRHTGTVNRIIQNGYSGFAISPAGTVFFSMESVYGPRRPDRAANERVCYSSFPGDPRPRAHPVIVIPK